MRTLFFPACICLMTLSGSSGFDVGGPLDSTYTDDGFALMRAVEIEAASEELSARTPTDANDMPADKVGDSSEKSDSIEPVDHPASPSSEQNSQSKPNVEATPPAEKHVVRRTRSEICDAVVSTALSNDLPIPFFIRLLFQESGFKPDVVSRAGAQGIAQFMPDTAATVGLNNPFDPLQAIEASAHLLGDLARQFGNLGLAAAAYNAGPRRIQDWLTKKGKLPEETQHYVKTITGRAPESWSDRGPGELTATLPREAPCQERVANVAQPREQKSPVPAARKRAVAAVASAHRTRARPPFKDEQTPTIMVAEHIGRRSSKTEDRPKADRKRKDAIQLAAASKKHHHKTLLSRR